MEPESYGSYLRPRPHSHRVHDGKGCSQASRFIERRLARRSHGEGDVENATWRDSNVHPYQCIAWLRWGRLGAWRGWLPCRSNGTRAGSSRSASNLLAAWYQSLDHSLSLETWRHPKGVSRTYSRLGQSLEIQTWHWSHLIAHRWWKFDWVDRSSEVWAQEVPGLP